MHICVYVYIYIYKCIYTHICTIYLSVRFIRVYAGYTNITRMKNGGGTVYTRYRLPTRLVILRKWSARTAHYSARLFGLSFVFYCSTYSPLYIYVCVCACVCIEHKRGKRRKRWTRTWKLVYQRINNSLRVINDEIIVARPFQLAENSIRILRRVREKKKKILVLFFESGCSFLFPLSFLL